MEFHLSSESSVSLSQTCTEDLLLQVFADDEYPMVTANDTVEIVHSSVSYSNQPVSFKLLRRRSCGCIGSFDIRTYKFHWERGVLLSLMYWELKFPEVGVCFFEYEVDTKTSPMGTQSLVVTYDIILSDKRETYKSWICDYPSLEDMHFSNAYKFTRLFPNIPIWDTR
jgi:hypothetical protein